MLLQILNEELQNMSTIQHENWERRTHIKNCWRNCVYIASVVKQGILENTNWLTLELFMKEVVGDSIIIWWLEQFCDPSFLSTVKMAWVDRGCWVDNFLFCNVFVIWLDDVVVITWFVKKLKKFVNSTPLSTSHFYCITFYTVPHA